MEERPKRSLRVFLCHASADRASVRSLYERLVADGVDAWLDQEKLMPGQNGREEIPKAVRDSDIFLVCLSKNSINKEGYVQREIREALEVAEEKPEGAIFIIPARLEECNVPGRLSTYHWVDFFAENGYQRLLRALTQRAEKIGVKPPSVPREDRQKTQPVRSNSLPLYMNFLAIDEGGQSYEPDFQDSDWPPNVSPGLVLRGSIDLVDPVPNTVSLMDVTFSQILGELEFIGKSITISEIRVP